MIPIVKRIRRVATRHHSSPTTTDSVVQVAAPCDEFRALASHSGGLPRKSGTMLKYTNVLRRWKPRHFILDNGLLIYSSVSGEPDDKENEDSASPSAYSTERERKTLKKSRKRRLLKRDYIKEDKERDIKEISLDDSDSCRFAIDVGHDVYHCKAETPAQRDEWVSELNRSKDYLRALIQRTVNRTQETSAATKPFNFSNGTAPLISEHTETKHTPHTPHTTHTTHTATISTNPSSNPSMTTLLQPSEYSDDSILEDDGLKEAEQGRYALVDELRRIVTLWRKRCIETTSTVDDKQNLLQTLGETFVDKDVAAQMAKVTASETANGLIGLLSWCLHVLQTNDDMFEGRLKADLARRMTEGLPVFPQVSSIHSTTIPPNANGDSEIFPLDDGSDCEFVDALSCAFSKRSSVGGDLIPMETCPTSTPLPSGGIYDDEVTQAPYELTQPVNIRRISTAALTKIFKGPRTHLPSLEDTADRPNMFGTLKDSVGKDLSKISLPLAMNEPISFVQRLAEDIEYCELLDQAAAEADPNRRLMYVAGMVVSHYSSTQGRVGKPFNPLLGETACLMRPDKGKGVRFISEQVSHHPPISASYAEGSGEAWKYYNAIEVKNKFWGKSLEVFPTGLNHIEIPKYGDHYVLEQVTACVHNIVVGRMWLDNYGDMEIVNRTNGGRCVIEFSKTGWMTDAKSFAAIRGTVYDASGKSRIKLGGNWTTGVYEDLGRGKKNLIWSVEERPPKGASQHHNMTKWAIGLNGEVQEEERKLLPPTHSRLRPDQRALEKGLLDLGSRLKQKLEDGQRKRMYELEEAGNSWEPMWFEKVTDEVSGQEDYRFNGKFFTQQAKEQAGYGGWSECPDLFSCAESPTVTTPAP